VLWHWYSRRL